MHKHCHGRHGRRGFGGFPEGLLAMGRGHGGPGDWERGWGRRGRQRMFDSGELRLVLLRLIGDEPRHGYDLIRAVEELTGGGYAPSPGVVYPTLSLLQDTGLIAEEEAEGARKAFAITDEGRAELDAKADEIEALLERLRHFGERQRRVGGGTVKRAMGNLLEAIRHRLGRDDVDEELIHRATAILDEAAQRIERL